jgi:hypothetical protein
MRGSWWGLVAGSGLGGRRLSNGMTPSKAVAVVPLLRVAP